MRLRTAFSLVFCGAVALAGDVVEQHPPPARPDGGAGGRQGAVPFAVGEAMVYRLRARWAFLRGGGEASLRVEAVDTLRGHPTWRLAMHMRGGIAVFRINDLQRSWLDVNGLFSRRFEQKLDQTTYDRDRTYDFLPDEMRFVNIANPADSGRLATPRPLDDVSFIYHVRTLPLAPGDEYVESRYYKSEGNPVTVRVLRRERIEVPAGSFDAVVVRPVIRTSGLFSEGGDAEVWLSDDERRLVLRLRARVRGATLTMDLESFSPGGPGR